MNTWKNSSFNLNLLRNRANLYALALDGIPLLDKKELFEFGITDEAKRILDISSIKLL
jgi:hypothetical protein